MLTDLAVSGTRDVRTLCPMECLWEIVPALAPTAKDGMAVLRDAPDVQDALPSSSTQTMSAVLYLGPHGAILSVPETVCISLRLARTLLEIHRRCMELPI